MKYTNEIQGRVLKLTIRESLTTPRLVWNETDLLCFCFDSQKEKWSLKLMIGNVISWKETRFWCSIELENSEKHRRSAWCKTWAVIVLLHELALRYGFCKFRSHSENLTEFWDQRSSTHTLSIRHGIVSHRLSKRDKRTGAVNGTSCPGKGISESSRFLYF